VVEAATVVVVVAAAAAAATAAVVLVVVFVRGCVGRHRCRRWGWGGRVPGQNLGKILFGQLLRKIWAFFGQNSCKIPEFC